MKRLKELLGSGAAAIYFIFPMCFIILILILTPILFIQSISTIIKSGFAGPNDSIVEIIACGFCISLSLLIPSLRKMYYVLPWLYSLIKVLYVNLMILNIGIAIVNMGYQEVSSARHVMFIILMVVQVVACRIAMCIYFKLRPVKYIEER